MNDAFPEDFFRPSPELTVRILKAAHETPLEDEDDPPMPIIADAREDIALRLWGCLAGLARAYTIARGQDRCRLHRDEAFPQLSHGMQRRLALPDSDVNRYLVEEYLLGGFFGWLEYEREGEYRAPWGIMQLEGDTLAFSEVYVPRFLGESYRRAASTRKGQGHVEDFAYAK